MKKFIEALWFQPYTPIILIGLVVWGAARFIYPPVQRYIQSKNPVLQEATIVTPTPIPSLATEEAIIAAVGKLMILPTDEKPQIITISNIAEFKDQPFFRNAKNGDILLIYNKNRVAILFDPVNNKIINTAPITTGEGTPTPAASSSAVLSESTPSGTPTATPTETP